MSSISAYIGEEAVCSVIEQSSHLHFKIHSQKPNLKDKEARDIYLVKQFAEGKDKTLTIEAFKKWSEHYLKHSSKPDQLFYLEMYTYVKVGGRPGARSPKGTSEISCFRLTQEEINEQPVIQQNPNNNLSEEYVKLRIEIERLNWEKEQLQAQLLDQEEEEEEEEEGSGSLFGINLDSPIGQSIGEIIAGLAQTVTKQVIGSGTNPLMEALQTIKQTNPKAEQVLIKIGEIAKSDPEQIVQMIDYLHGVYFTNPQNNGSNSTN